jgi:uncharacterized OB-fold protein
MSKETLPGTPLSSEEFEKSITIEEHPNLEYSWDDGIAISRYLKELKEGRIIARTCCGCNRTMLPPRMFCELCYRPTDEWAFVEDTGVVNTFCVTRVNWDASRRGPDEPPLIPAVVEIDGASKGMGILHLLGEVDPKKVKIGMRVKAVWKPKAQREGKITDIKYFKPY